MRVRSSRSVDLVAESRIFERNFHSLDRFYCPLYFRQIRQGGRAVILPTSAPPPHDFLATSAHGLPNFFCTFHFCGTTAAYSFHSCVYEWKISTRPWGGPQASWPPAPGTKNLTLLISISIRCYSILEHKIGENLCFIIFRGGVPRPHVPRRFGCFLFLVILRIWAMQPLLLSNTNFIFGAYYRCWSEFIYINDCFHQ